MLTHSRSTVPDISELFRQQYRPTPQIDKNYWSFMLGGLVDVPLCLSYADLLALPATTQASVIACAGNPPGGPSIGQATWHGVELHRLLDDVTLKPGASYAHLFAADGYTTCISLAQLQKAILVYGMNGESLPSAHGYPARLIVPGLSGYKMPKWIQRIVLAETPLEGLWEARGWSMAGETQIISQITSPHDQAAVGKTTILRGIAYAGKQPVKGVELSVNGGPWMPARVAQEEAHTLARWAIEWTPYTTGAHRITVRAIDAAGVIQPDNPASSPFPNGATAHHAITVHV